MPTTQTNGIDTATFERRPSATCTADSGVETRLTPVIERETADVQPNGAPPVAGGQGRTADELTDTLKVCGWLMLAIVQIGAVICALGIINAVAGPLVTAIAALCLIVVGVNCYGIGRAQ